MKSRPTLAQSFVVFALLFASTASLRTLLPAALADTQQIRTRWHIAKWQSSGDLPSPAEWGEARGQLRSAQGLTPDDPNLAESLGYLHLIQSMRLQQFPELMDPLLVEALALFNDASRFRPMSPFAWGNTALLQHTLNKQGGAYWASFDKAMLYGQRDPGVASILAQIGFARWEDAGAERRRRLVVMVANTNEQNGNFLRGFSSTYGNYFLAPKLGTSGD